MRLRSKGSEDPRLDPSALFRSVRTRRRKHLRHWWQWVLVAIPAVLLLVGAAGIWFYYSAQGEIQDPIGSVDPAAPDEPFNVLLVGSDSRRGLTPREQRELGADPVEGQRADTLIVAHVDPASSKVTMVQFPRDLYVPILDEGRDRINSALEKGHNHLNLAVERLTGLEINHYVQVNIAGFKDIVDEIGGVTVCITEPIPFDRNTGFEIGPDELGLVEMDGETALSFVRSRHTLRGGDFDRIRNQQKFLSAALDKIVSVPTLLNPARLLDLKRAASDNIVIDDNTTLLGLADLADQIKAVDPDTYEAYTVPNRGPTMVGPASVVAPDPPAMRALFRAVARNESPAAADGLPDIAPKTIRVGVFNASGADGAAAAGARALVRATSTSEGPVRIAVIDDVRRKDVKTAIVRYGPKAESQARVVAAALPGARLEGGRVPRGIDVQVLVGRRFRTRPLLQILPIPLPAPGALPAECRG